MDDSGPSGSFGAIRTTSLLTVQRPNTGGSGSGSGSRKSSIASCSDDSPAASSTGDFQVSSLTYRDFFPKMLEEGGTFTSPIYEDFSFLVARANEWLISHREFDILNVECVEILTQHNTKVVDPNKASYAETAKDWTEFVRGLRMWLIPALPKTSRSQSKAGLLRYFDVVPECTHAGIVSIDYTRLSGLVEALNDKLRNSPINGDVLAVQTMTLRFHSNEGVDSNRTCFSLHGHKQRIRLYFIRVFYMEYNDGQIPAKLECLEDIGIADFVPQISRHQTTARQHIEALSMVITRAGDWFIRYQEDGHPGLRIVNMQTVVLHVKDSKNVDTQQTFYMATGDGERYFYELRFVRLIYARQIRPDCADMPAYPRVYMKLFCPTQMLTTDSDSKRQAKFGNVPDIVGRIQEWISEHHPPIIGIETHGYSSYVGDEIIMTAESPYLYDQGHEGKCWIQSIRVYYEGEYVESSQELPSPGFRNKDRRGSSVHGKRPVEHRLSGSNLSTASAGGGGGTGGSQNIQGSWPPLAAGSMLAPIDPTGAVKPDSSSPSPRSARRRSKTQDELKDDIRDTKASKQKDDKSDKDCILT